jgi:predicted phosphate transport protein (TIGR00153 family)
MFGKLMPREGKFFDLFNAHAELIVEGGQQLVAMMSALAAGAPGVEAYAAAIDKAETSADKVTHETVAQLHKTFITPLDRDEIHQLITRMDDILDLTQDVAQTIALYDIQRATPEAITLAEITLMCCERVKTAVNMLHSMDNAQSILSTCREIDHFESDADRVMRGAMSKLFRDEPDVRQLIKLKAVYELLETITDRCEDVANILEGIVLENS